MKTPIGKIKYGNGDSQVFYGAKDYIQALKEALSQLGVAGGFRLETMTEDPAIRKAIDDLFLNACGVEEDETEFEGEAPEL